MPWKGGGKKETRISFRGQLILKALKECVGERKKRGLPKGKQKQIRIHLNKKMKEE